MAQGTPEVLTGQNAMGVGAVEQMKPVLHFHYCWQNDQIVRLLSAAALVQGLPQLDEMSAKTGDIHSRDFHHQTFCLISLNSERKMKEIAVAEVGEVHSFLQKVMQNLKTHCL